MLLFTAETKLLLQLGCLLLWGSRVRVEGCLVHIGVTLLLPLKLLADWVKLLLGYAWVCRGSIENTILKAIVETIVKSIVCFVAHDSLVSLFGCGVFVRRAGFVDETTLAGFVLFNEVYL